MLPLRQARIVPLGEEIRGWRRTSFEVATDRTETQGTLVQVAIKATPLGNSDAALSLGPPTIYRRLIEPLLSFAGRTTTIVKRFSWLARPRQTGSSHRSEFHVLNYLVR